jgi:hypothetical protein
MREKHMLGMECWTLFVPHCALRALSSVLCFTEYRRFDCEAITSYPDCDCIRSIVNEWTDGTYALHLALHLAS